MQSILGLQNQAHSDLVIVVGEPHEAKKKSFNMFATISYKTRILLYAC